MVQRFRKLSDWPNWPVLCLYKPPAKTPARTQNLPHKYYAPNFLQTFCECPLTLPYQDWPNWPVLLSNVGLIKVPRFLPLKWWGISSFLGIFYIHIYSEIIILKVNLIHSEVPKVVWLTKLTGPLSV